MPDTFLTNMAAADNVILDALGETVSVFDESETYLGNVVGIFERQFVESQNIQGSAPTFTYNDTEIVIEEGYTITYETQSHVVRYLEPDGTGITMLVLREK